MTALDRTFRTDAASNSRRLRASFLEWIAGFLAIAQIITLSGCSSVSLPSAKGVDLMSPSSNLLFPGSASQSSPYQMHDGTVAGSALGADGSMTEDAYRKIREAKAQNAIVLQVAGDAQPVRLLPLPPAEQSVFLSELLTQTGVLKKFNSPEVTLYRPSADSISGVRMDVKFTDAGTVDPASDYGLRPGDRVQVSRKSTSTIQSLVKIALRR